LINREIKERIQKESVIVDVICDRCGEKCKKYAGIVESFPYEGTYGTMRILIDDPKQYPKVEYREFELCGECTKCLIRLIDMDWPEI